MSDTQQNANPEFQFLASFIGVVAGETEHLAYAMQTIENGGVKPEWFRDPRYQKIFEAAFAEWRESGSIEMFKVLNRVRNHPGASEALEECITGTTSVAHLEYYINELRKRYVYAVVHKTGYKFLNELTPDNVVESVEDFAAKISNLQDMLADGDKELRQLSDFMASSIEKKRRLHEERFVKHNWKYLEGLPWPWQCLNQIYTGIKPGLNIIAALPGQGKTAMSVDLSCYWNLRGIKHGYVCIDMSAEQLADRYPSVLAQVSLARLNFGAPASDVELYAQGWENTSRCNNVWITEVDEAKKISEIAHRGVRSLGWKAIIVDYLQLVSSDDTKSDLAYLRVKYATQAMHRLSKRLKIPIICLVQLNKNFATEARKEGRGADLDDLGDSSEIARAAETILVMYKDHQIAKYWETNPPTQLAFGDKNDAIGHAGLLPQYYGSSWSGQESFDMRVRRMGGQLSLAKILRPMWVDVIKNRQGGPGKIPFVMYPNYLMFRPGNHEAPKSKIMLGNKEVEANVQGFEQIVDDWIYASNDWILEVTNALPQRGYKVPGETYEEMYARLEIERKEHSDVRQFVRGQHDNGVFREASGEAAR